MLLHLEFTHNFSTIFGGSFDIRASREFFPNEVRSPEFLNRGLAVSTWNVVSPVFQHSNCEQNEPSFFGELEN
jgi:hypothetical protein